MNKNQQKTLIFTAVIIGLMIIFPPYETSNRHGFIFDTGYGFIFNLPDYSRVRQPNEAGYIHSRTNGKFDPEAYLDNLVIYKARLNIATLVVQIISVLIVGGLMVLAFKTKGKE